MHVEHRKVCQHGNILLGLDNPNSYAMHCSRALCVLRDILPQVALRLRRAGGAAGFCLGVGSGSSIVLDCPFLYCRIQGCPWSHS